MTNITHTLLSFLQRAADSRSNGTLVTEDQEKHSVASYRAALRRDARDRSPWPTLLSSFVGGALLGWITVESLARITE